MFWRSTSHIVLNTSLKVFGCASPKHGPFRARYRPSVAVVWSSPTDRDNARQVWITDVCSNLYNVLDGKEAPCFGEAHPISS